MFVSSFPDLLFPDQGRTFFFYNLKSKYKQTYLLETETSSFFAGMLGYYYNVSYTIEFRRQNEYPNGPKLLSCVKFECVGRVMNSVRSHALLMRYNLDIADNLAPGIGTNET